uniref:SCAN box domain-containing protein n=1 Tax=Pelusios castaneus TaxID=367368 RepID=A0A8C8SQ70_9SAUR
GGTRRAGLTLKRRAPQQLVRDLAAQHQSNQEKLVQQMAAAMSTTGPSMSGLLSPDAAGAGMGGTSVNLPLRLTKMGPGDDPEAFLVTFERVATAARWPTEHWATLLAPYLTGPAQMAYRNLDPQDALIYREVKKAVLDQTGINPETYRQRLRRTRFPTGARPRAVAQQIKEDCWRWLEPDQKTGDQVAEEVALVQGLGQPEEHPPGRRVRRQKEPPPEGGKAPTRP